MVDLEVVMVVPGLARSGPDLDETHALLEKTAGRQELAGLGAGAVGVPDVLGLAREVEDVDRLHLHAVGELEGLDAGLELSVPAPGLLVAPVEGGEEVELAPLLVGRAHGVADVADELLDVLVLGVEIGPLVGAGQEGGLPVLGLLDRIPSGAHHDETREVLVLAAEAVGDPGAHARAHQPRVAAVQQEQRGLVVGHVGVHRADHADVVDRLRRVLEEFAHLDPALAVLGELEHRRKRVARLALGLEILGGQGLPGEAVQGRLGIEGVDMGGAAVEEEMQDALGLSGVMGLARGQGVERDRVLGGEDAVHRAHEVREPEGAHAHPGAAEQFAAGEEAVLGAGRVVVRHRRSS
jgi:hypothetical protein